MALLIKGERLGSGADLNRRTISGLGEVVRAEGLALGVGAAGLQHLGQFAGPSAIRGTGGQSGGQRNRRRDCSRAPGYRDAQGPTRQSHDEFLDGEWGLSIAAASGLGDWRAPSLGLRGVHAKGYLRPVGF